MVSPLSRSRRLIARAIAVAILATTSDAFSTRPATKTTCVVGRRPWPPSCSRATMPPLMPSRLCALPPGEDRTREDILEEADAVLASVGWAPPSGDAELSSDDPFVRRIDESVRKETGGVGLDGLLNPAKVVNLERDLYNLRASLAAATGNGDIFEAAGATTLTTDECDGGGGGEEVESLRSSISKKENAVAAERRSVFKGWLKNVFLGQAVVSMALSWSMATNPDMLFGGFGWYHYQNMDTSISVLGFWWWWLFIVPSLRSRRPAGPEKKALDIAFLGTPLISLLSPVVTKDTEIIWLANFAVVAGAYAFAFLIDGDEGGGDDGGSSPGWLKFIYKSLDFGSGKERGTRR